MERAASLTSTAGQAKLYQEQALQLKNLKQSFIDGAVASGKWEAVQVSTTSATERMNRAIADQKLGIVGWLKNQELVKKSMQEQIALQNSLVMTSKQQSFGKSEATLMIPKGATQELSNARTELGFMNKVLASASQSAINWGKNTQWAGRQLTAGFSMPVLMAAAAVGKLAYDMDAQLTHVQKIYEYSSKNTAAQAQESAQLRANSINLVKNAAEQYGASMESVLQVEANFAATGVRGNQLMEDTNAVVRATTLTFQGASASAQDYQDVFKATIALQNIYKMSAEDVSKTFNYLNVVESQTSLRMKDVIDAIPRSLGPLKDLGVSFTQYTTMLVAMKQNGVPAAQGANALKSAAAGLLHIAPGTVTAFKALNIDINDFVKQANGNVFDVLARLAKAKNDISNPDGNLQMEKAMSLLFGKQQMARLTGVVDSLNDIHDATTQVGRAYMTASMTADEMAAKSDEQLKRLHNSLSGQLRSAVNTLKVEFANLGTTVLPIFTGILGGVTSLIKSFDGLGDGTKKFILIGLGLGALLGPVIMMIGLFANWIGNIGKAGSAIAALRYKFEILTPEQRVNQQLAKDMNNVWDAQARTTATLANEVNRLAQSFNNVAVAQGHIMEIDSAGVARMGSFGLIPQANGRLKYSSGSTVDGNKVGGRYASAEHDALYMKTLADQEEKMAETEKASVSRWSGISKYAGTAALAAATLGSFVATDNSALQQTLSIVTAVSMVMTMLPIKQIAMGIAGWIAAAGGLEAAMTRAAVSMTFLMDSALPFLAAGGLLVSAVLLWNKINNDMTEASRTQEKINSSTKDWSDILGFTVKNYGARASADDAHTKALSEDNALVSALVSKNAAVVEQIQNAHTQQQKLNLAIEEGMKVIQNGGDSNQAYMAVRTALLAAHAATESNIDGLMVKVHAQINFDSPDQIAAKAQAIIQQAMDQAAKSVNDNGGWLNSLFSSGSNINEVSDKAKAAAEKAGTFWWDQFKNATSHQQRSDLFDSARKTIDDQLQSLYGDVERSNSKDLQTLGINSASQLGDLWHRLSDPKFVSQMTAPQKAAVDNLKANFGQSFDQILGITKDFINAIAASDPALASLAGKFDSFEQLAGYIGNAADSMDSLTTSADDAAAAIAKVGGIPLSGQDMTDALKQTMQGTMDAVYTELDRRAQEFNKSQQDATQQAGDAKVKTIEDNGKKEIAAQDAVIKKLERDQAKQTKAVKDGYDDRIKSIQNTLKAEEAVDKARQRMFDNEIKRMQRLAQQATSTVDFNVALRSGNLDEAAKVMNDAQAQDYQNILDDQKQAEQDALDAKKQATQDSIDGITAERDAKLSALSDVQAAEKQAAQNKKAQIQQDIDNAKSAEQQKTKDAIAELQKRQDATRRELDMELQIKKAFLPKNHDELVAQVNDVIGVYNSQLGNGFLDPKSKEWGAWFGKALTTNVQTSANNLENAVKWKNVAADIENQMAGQFGLTGKQLTQWLQTGVFPGSVSNEGYVQGAAPADSAQRNLNLQNNANRIHAHAVSHSGGLVLHSGGMVNPSWTQHARVGIPRSAALYHSEVPTVLKRGEFVMNEHAVARLGVKSLNAMNQGHAVHHEGGLVFRHGGGGLGDGIGATMIASMFGRLLSNTLARTLQGTTQNMQATQDASYGIGQAGKYAGVAVGGTQMEMASIIMNVGRSMGASNRDLVVAIMTAMQESSLRNLPYGDRDSLGLFQQRPSAGWGTPEQIMDPSYAASKFFESLLKIQGRDGMPSLGAEAQAVQRSAFPGLYDQWATLAEAIVKGTPVSAINGNGQLRPPDSDGTPAYRGGWTNHLAPGIAATVANVLASIPGGQIITSAWRSHAEQMQINPSAPNSDHPRGKAVDIAANAYSADGSIMGDTIAAAFRNAPGVHQILWKTMEGGNHFNHVHVGFSHAGGVAGLPQLRVGGDVKYDNTIANLHRNETVLTAPLSQKLKDGIDRIDSGTGSNYNVTIDMRGATVRSEIDFEKAVVNALHNYEAKLGRNRTVS